MNLTEKSIRKRKKQSQRELHKHPRLPQNSSTHTCVVREIDHPKRLPSNKVSTPQAIQPPTERFNSVPDATPYSRQRRSLCTLNINKLFSPIPYAEAFVFMLDAQPNQTIPTISVEYKFSNP